MSVAEAQREFAVTVVQRLHEAGYEALWAGGCVRDLLLGRTPGDYDVATNARPDQVREVFGRRGTLAVGEAFGVILVRGPSRDVNVEVATFRTDLEYRDGRRPEGVHFTTAEEDAKRRDFTINGMFYDPLASRVIDFVGGEADLGREIVRAIGDPRARFAEDKLRMLRAVRFAATLEFDLDDTTAAAAREMAHEVDVVSVERIATELRKMLVDRHRRRAIELLDDVGLLACVLPEVSRAFVRPGAREHALHVLHLLGESTFEPAFAALLREVTRHESDLDVRAIGRRLKLSNEEIDHVAWLVEHRSRIDLTRALPLHELKPLLAHRHAHDLLTIARTDVLAAAGDLTDVMFCEEYVRQTPRERLDPPPLATGRDLIDRGLTPGPRFAELLETVRHAQLDEEIATPEEAATLLERLLASDEVD